MIGLEAQMQTVRRLEPMQMTGRVAALRGLTVVVEGLPMPVGSLVTLKSSGPGEPADRARVGDDSGLGEIVGFDGRNSIVMMLGSTSGIRAGDRVVGLHPMQSVGVGDQMLGRVINGLGRPIDGLGSIHHTTPRPLDPEPLSALSRRRIKEPMWTGVRAIDLMTTLGRGQRLGVFAGPGVGKSTLLGAVARSARADVSVIALIGERGREVGDFLEQSLGSGGLARSVVVVATGDESALMRTRAALVACTIAEHFRDEGRAVMLVMDSITRFAHAQRQIGLSVGEAPSTRGYTPSVFAAMSRLLERAGTLEDAGKGKGGSITGIYSILVEGDDMTEPVADAARGILDGHIILARSLAQRAHYPAIDVLDSISRVADDVCERPHISARRQVLRLLAAYRQVEDLIQIGAYAKGSNPLADVAIRYHDAINDLLRQDLGAAEPASAGPPRTDGRTEAPMRALEEARARLVKIALESGAAYQQIAAKRA